MDSTKPDSDRFSYHAPARLAAPRLVEEQVQLVREDLDVQLLDALVQPVMVTNPERQIVFINAAARRRFDIGERDALGKRPGDIIGCVHVDDAPSGCGTGIACRSCGWTNALLVAESGAPAVREASLLLKSGKAIDARLNAVPVSIRGTRYIVNEMSDVTAERRREQLEQTFFHDILNIATAVKGLIELNCSLAPPVDAVLTDALKSSTDRLIEEIRSQRTMSDAQDGRLRLHLETRGVDSAMSIVLGTVMQLAADRGVALKAEITPDTPAIRSDHTLLGRVLTNLAKNAIEASPAGSTVSIEVTPIFGGVQFAVHNDTVIPESFQSHIFHRSRSTKGADRGIGTFSAKLLTEQYLRGKVHFDSTDIDGTTFQVAVPLTIDAFID